MIRAVFFDLFKTLGDFRGTVTDEAVCEVLRSRGYDVYPQTFRHAFAFVTFIDNPRIGFGSYPEMFKKAFERIGVAVDDATLGEVSELYEGNPFQLYPWSAEAVKRVKSLSLKTAIVTTPPRFWFESGIEPILCDVDYICTSSEARCAKSNPRIFNKPLQALALKPAEVVVIGDDPELDIRNPRSLGMKTIQITESAPDPSADAKAKNVLEAVKTVEKWL